VIESRCAGRLVKRGRSGPSSPSAPMRGTTLTAVMAGALCACARACAAPAQKCRNPKVSGEVWTPCGVSPVSWLGTAAWRLEQQRSAIEGAVLWDLGSLRMDEERKECQ